MEEVKVPITEGEQAQTTETTPANDDKTVGEILETVPLPKYLDTKKENKALKAELAELKAKKEEGASMREVATDLKSIADKYDVAPEFLSEFYEHIYAKAKGDVEETLQARLKPLEEKEKREKIDQAFEEHYAQVIEELPEYAKIINKGVIKSLSLLPENSKKTFQQIIEETYGKTVVGKKTMETSTPRGGKEVSLDLSRMKDPAYFKEVMANPELKKKYNENLHNRIKL